MIQWYIKIFIYIFFLTTSFFVVYQIDFNKILRIGKKQFAIILWVLLSLALGYLTGSLFIVIAKNLLLI